MNTLPATSYDEVFDLLYRNEEIQQEAEYIPFPVEEHKNEEVDDLLDEIREYMSTPVVLTESRVNVEKQARKVKELTFADVVREYLLSPSASEDHKEELEYASNRAKAESYARAVAINRKIMPSFFKTADELEAEAKVRQENAKTAEVKVEAATSIDLAKQVQPVDKNRPVMPSSLETGVNEPITDVQAIEEIEENDDHLVWAELGHIRGLDPADPDTDYLAWSGLGHIKDHDAEVQRQKEEDRLLLQVDTHVAFKGLIREINEDPEGFKARVTRLDGDKAAETEAIIVESTTQPEEVIVQDDEADFAAWKAVLAANDTRNQTERKFWAETNAAEARRTRTRRALAAAAVALVAIPAVGSLLEKLSSRISARQNIPAEARNGYNANLAAGAGQDVVAPEFEFATTTSTVVVENGVVTVTKTGEVPTISLADIAAEAKAKADAEDLAAAEAAAAAAEAEKNRVKSFEEKAEALCGSSEVNDEFGPRIHPVTGEFQSLHAGMDFDCKGGSDIHSFDEGIVTLAGWNGGYGNMVEVLHPNGTKTRYAHQSSIAEDIEVGVVVAKGQILGKVGSTGVSTGFHLHFELHDSEGNPINPRVVLGWS